MNCSNLIDAMASLENGNMLSGITVLNEAQELISLNGGTNPSAEQLLQRIRDWVKAELKQSSDFSGTDEKELFIRSLRSMDSGGSGENPGREFEEDVDYDLLISFISESRHHLEDIESRLLQLESTADPELVNDVFRSIHTIKGVSSFLGLSRIKTLSHGIETELDQVRQGRRPVDGHLIDILLNGTDRLTEFIDGLNAWSDTLEPTDPGPLREPELDIDDIIEALEALDETSPTDAAASPLPSTGEVLYTPEMLRGFAAESLDILDATETALMNLDEGGSHEDIHEAFRGIHTIKGNAGFFELHIISNLCQSLETVLEAMRNNGQTTGAAAVVNALLEGIDSLRSQLSRLVEEGPLSPDGIPADAPDIDEPRTIGQVLMDMGAADQTEIDNAVEIQNRRIGEILVDSGVIDESKLGKALEIQSAQTRKNETQQNSHMKRDVRVDTVRLDNLFTMIGELITAHAMVVNSPDLQGKDLADFSKAASSMGKIIREVQGISMAIRMIPVDGLFSKMRRLTRDLARKFGKKVDFRTVGEDTEMDRQIIEQISDPLVHIIRNAVDHGLELPKEREAAGKSPTGTVTLSARYEGNEVWISVTDDGGGLSRENILRKAVAQGMNVGEDGGMSLDDERVWAMIFEPGFSTAEVVSEVSGRGVGMDVVRMNLEKLRGNVDIQSETGKGTEVVLQIPMTLAIIDGINFRVNDMHFALPLADILEFYRPADDDIVQTPNGRRILRLRDDLLPVVTLKTYYGLSDNSEDSDYSVYIIIGAGQKRAALPADEILGNQQLVIKALPDHLRNVRALSGCSILGNGDVALILDAGYLLSSEKPEKHQ